MKIRTHILLMALIAVLIANFSSVPECSAQSKQQKFTEWGWPLPYEKVSDASINWLKQKGWWPLKLAYQIDCLPFLAVKKGLLRPGY